MAKRKGYATRHFEAKVMSAMACRRSLGMGLKDFPPLTFNGHKPTPMKTAKYAKAKRDFDKVQALIREAYHNHIFSSYARG